MAGEPFAAAARVYECFLAGQAILSDTALKQVRSYNLSTMHLRLAERGQGRVGRTDDDLVITVTDEGPG